MEEKYEWEKIKTPTVKYRLKIGEGWVSALKIINNEVVEARIIRAEQAAKMVAEAAK